MLSDVTLIGNVGKIESQYTTQAKLITKFSLAVNIGYGDNKKTNWYYCTAWERTAEFVQQRAQVGTQLFVEGELFLREWKTKDSEDRLSPDVTVSKFRVLSRGKKKDEETIEELPEFMKD